MEAENKTELDDAVVLVLMRNEFYRQKYHLAMGVYFLSIIVVMILIGMLFYLYKHPSTPLYFPADNVGRLIQDIPLTQPNMSLEDATAWTVEAVETANSYDFVNYRAELQQAQKYFAPYGWRKFLQGLTASNNLVALTQRKMISIAKVAAPPKLLGQGVLKTGAYGYKFEIPVLVTYMVPPFDEKSSFQNPLIVSVVVQRQNLLSSYKGLGVMQMNATIVSSPTQQNLTTPPGTT